ncbi:MAG: DUF1820 family protein [Pseudomonadota bacterium]
MTRKPRTYFVITWRDPTREGAIRTLKARRIEDSDLGPTFVCLSDFVFDTGGLVIDPEEEDLKSRFADTKRLHISIYSVLSIEERGSRHPGLQLDQERSSVVFLPSDKKHD